MTHRLRAGRIAALALNTVVFAFATLVIVTLALHVLLRFAVVTLGLASQLGRTLSVQFLDPLRWSGPAALLAATAVVAAGLRSRESRAWSYHTMLTPWPVFGLVLFEMLYYRSLGLIAMLVAIVTYVRLYTGRGTALPLAASVLIMWLAGVLPFDISLQSRSGPPRLLPATYGLPAGNMWDMETEFVSVDGCSATYYHPAQVWVW